MARELDRFEASDDDDLTLPPYDLPGGLELDREPGEDGSSACPIWPTWTHQRWGLPEEEDQEALANELGETWDDAGAWVDEARWTLA